MAVYRESPPTWRKRLPLIIGGVIVLLALVAIFIIPSLSNTPGLSPAAPQPTSNSALYDKLDEIATSIELFGIEYPKINATTSKAQTGAPGAIDHALSVYDSVKVPLSAVNESQAAQLKKGLDTLKGALDANPTIPDVVTLTIAQTDQRLLSLRLLISGTQISTPTNR